MGKSIFVSYCQESTANSEKIHEIADKLETLGLKVVIDKYDLTIGNDINHFMNALANDDFRAILVMCTSEYKRKADNNVGGVGYEMQQYRHHLSDPKQEYILPIIIEQGDKNELIPQAFPKNPYCVDLSKPDSFEENFQSLVSFLQGVRPARPIYSELNALIYYTNSDFPGLPEDLVGTFRESMTSYVSSVVSKIRRMPYELGIHIDSSKSIELLEKISESIVEFSDNLTNKDIAIDLLSLLWGANKDMQKHKRALRIIQHAITIGESDTQNTNYKVRFLALSYQKAISLHSLDRLNEALSIYETIVSDQSNCDILHPVVVFYAMLYKGHIHYLSKEFNRSIKVYEHLIENIDGGLASEVEFIKDLEVLRYLALNALLIVAKDIPNESVYDRYKKLQNDFMKNNKCLSEIPDIEKVNNGMMSPKPFYPPQLILPVRCLKGIGG